MEKWDLELIKGPEINPTAVSILGEKYYSQESSDKNGTKPLL